MLLKFFMDFMYAFEQEKIIRTALSRINGKAVLTGLEGDNPTKIMLINDIPKFQTFTDGKEWGLIIASEPWLLSERMYFAFDKPLREGKSLDEALTALDEAMELLKII